MGLLLLFKSLLPGAVGDLFATHVQVKGHTKKDGTFVTPHSAIRHKAVHPEPQARTPDLFSVQHPNVPHEENDDASPSTQPPREEGFAGAVGRVLSEDGSFSAEDVAGQWADGSTEEVLDLLHADVSGFAVLPGGRWMRMSDYLDRKRPKDGIGEIHQALSSDKIEEHLRPRLEQQARALTEATLTNAAEMRVEPEGSEMLSDDPSSPNYRYRDTGYVAGSRKELAATVIRAAAREGRQVLPTQIDWTEIEQNHREARELITKSNLFGAVDWSILRERGMEPGAGFLIDRVYAAIGTAPEDTAQARQDYALGLQTIRARLERCNTPDEVGAAIDEIGKEYTGRLLTAEETSAYQLLVAGQQAAWREQRKHEDAAKPLYDAAQSARAAVYPISREIENRKARKWAAKPELEDKLAAATALAERLWDEWGQKLEEGRPRAEAAREIVRRAGVAMDALVQQATIRNATTNPLHRAWRTLGERFLGVIQYRSSKGSEVFAKHVAAARSGKVSDWSWAEKEGAAAAPRISKESTRFQLTVPDTFTRIGGRQVSTPSTGELKARFGLRDVQSGNWVLCDQASAKWHTEQAAAGLADLADVIGADDALIAFNGRLALAFGARGHGSAGFKDGAPRAHYETVQRVINITKMQGGGSLAHEWFHALDNLIGEAESGRPGKADDFMSVAPELVPAGPIRDAVVALRSAMFDGVEREVEPIAYTKHHVRMAELNVDRPTPSIVARKIKAAGDVHAAVRAVDEHFSPDGKPPTSRKMKQLARDWRQIAVAHHHREAEGGTVDVQAGPSMSSFAIESARLDSGGKTYWSTAEEMAARAFQSYVEDKLADLGRRNDYLSALADNRHHEGNPYPAGEERRGINEAFDRLFQALRNARSLAKTLAVLDAYWKAGRKTAGESQ